MPPMGQICRTYLQPLWKPHDNSICTPPLHTLERQKILGLKYSIKFEVRLVKGTALFDVSPHVLCYRATSPRSLPPSTSRVDSDEQSSDVGGVHHRGRKCWKPRGLGLERTKHHPPPPRSGSTLPQICSRWLMYWGLMKTIGFPEKKGPAVEAL